MPRDNRHRAQRSTERKCANVTHEYLCGIGVEPQKAQAGTGNSATENGQLTAAGDTSSQDFLRVLAQSEKTKVMEEAKRAQSAAKDTIMVPDDPLPGSPGESAQQGRTQGT